MATLLLSCTSSQEVTIELYTDALIEDQRLVGTTSTYQTTLIATEILTPIVATLTPSPQAIIHLFTPARFL